MLWDLDSLCAQPISKSRLSAEQLRDQVAALGGRWSIAGDEVKLVLPGPGMAKAGQAVAEATRMADEMDHHPSIRMEYPQTILLIHTHDQNAITALDVIYAARLEAWLRNHGW